MKTDNEGVSFGDCASFLDRVVSPASAVEALAKRGIKVSERALREKARRIGAYREVGQAMFFLPEDLEKIMEPKACSHRKGARKVRIGLPSAPLSGKLAAQADTKAKRQTPDKRWPGIKPMPLLRSKLPKVEE